MSPTPIADNSAIGIFICTNLFGTTISTPTVFNMVSY